MRCTLGVAAPERNGIASRKRAVAGMWGSGTVQTDDSMVDTENHMSEHTRTCNYNVGSREVPALCGRPAGIVDGVRAYCAGHALRARAPSRSITTHFVSRGRAVYSAIQAAVITTMPDASPKHMDQIVAAVFERIQRQSTVVLLEEGDRLWKASDVMKVVSEQRSITATDVVDIVNLQDDAEKEGDK